MTKRVISTGESLIGMNGRGRIVFVGEYRFPEGDAAAIRTMSLARICRDLGYSVLVVGKGRLRREHYSAKDGAHWVEGIQYTTMNPDPVSTRERILHPLRRLRLYQTTLESLDLTDTKAVVINACDSALHVPGVMAFCRRSAVPLIGDVCEWYDPGHRKFGRLNPWYICFWLVFNLALPRFRNLIVVSTLLERRFERTVPHIARIPAPVDVDGTNSQDHTPAERLVLLYAGMPGRKDLLREVIEGLSLLERHEQSRFEFRLLGPTRRDLLKILGKSAQLLDELRGIVVPLGRVPHHQVISELQGAHFTILLRPDKQYANAGFPSKVAESLAAGTPVLLNDTSDLAHYLGDGMAVSWLKEPSPEEVARALREVLTMGPTTLAAMRIAARRKAEEHFDYRAYLGEIDQYLHRVR